MVTKIELPKGAKPLFKTEAEYQRFRKDYINAVSPNMKKHTEARRKSEHAARQRLVD
jgi:hypothetical protein